LGASRFLGAGSIVVTPDFFMTTETAQLLQAISRMNNLFGFCARHYVSPAQNPEKFIEEVYKAIKENRINVDQELKEQFEIFFSKN
jgi:hypothetical protein